MPLFGDLPTEIVNLVSCNLDQCSIFSLMRTAKYLGMLEPLLYQRVHLNSNMGAYVFNRAVKVERNACRAAYVHSLKISYQGKRVSLNRIVALMTRLPNLQNFELVPSGTQGVDDVSFICKLRRNQRLVASLPNLQMASIDSCPELSLQYWLEGYWKLMTLPSLRIYKIRHCPGPSPLDQACNVPLDFLEISNLSLNPFPTLIGCRPTRRLLLCVDSKFPNFEQVVNHIANNQISSHLESLFIDIGPSAPQTNFNSYDYLSFKSFPRLRKLGLRWGDICQAIFPSKESLVASRMDIFPLTLQCLWLHFDDETDKDFDFVTERFLAFLVEMTKRKSTIAPRLKQVLFWLGRLNICGSLLAKLYQLNNCGAGILLQEDDQTFVRRLTYKVDRLQNFTLNSYRAEPIEYLV